MDGLKSIRGHARSSVACSLVVKLWVEGRRYDRTVLVDWKTEPRDVVRAIGAKPLEGTFAKLLDWFPGNEAATLAIDRKRLAVPRLPAELEGLTIAHISDLHMTGRVGAKYFDYVADQVNSLRPDVIAITGDLIEKEACWPWLESSLCRLCAPLGVYFILGNHDDFIDAARTRKLLADAGLVCLSGRWVRADWNGAAVLVGGNELPWMAPAASLAELPRAARAAATSVSSSATRPTSSRGAAAPTRTSRGRPHARRTGAITPIRTGGQPQPVRHAVRLRSLPPRRHSATRHPRRGRPHAPPLAMPARNRTARAHRPLALITHSLCGFCQLFGAATAAVLAVQRTRDITKKYAASRVLRRKRWIRPLWFD